MGNFIIIPDTDFIAYTITGASSAVPNFPSSNVQNPEKRDEVWQTTVTTDSWITLDLGAAKPVNAVALLNVNFTSYRIQGNASDAWASPAFDSGLIAVSKEHFTHLYRNYKSLAGFNYRYLRIFIPTQTPIDASTGFIVGGIIVSDKAQELPENPSYGSSMPIELIGFEQQFLSGRVERIRWRQNYRRVRLRLPFEVDRGQTQLQTLSDKFNHDKGMLVYPNKSLREYTDDSPIVFLVEREGDIEYRLDDWGTARIEFLLRERI